MSPSKKGYHIITIGSLPDDVKHKSNHNIDKISLVEIYDDARFFTVTGDIFGENNEMKNGQAEIDWFLEKFNMLNERRTCIKNQNSIELEFVSDDELVENIRKSASKDKFNKLYAGETIDCDSDKSRADMSFCTILAYFTDNLNQIDRIYRKSKLYRSKWDELRGSLTYGDMTIKNAVEYLKSNNNGEFCNMTNSEFVTENGVLYYVSLKGEKKFKTYVCKDLNVVGKVRDEDSAS